MLGPLEVSAAAGPVDIGGPKERALLAILLVHANVVISTDRLVEDLWRGTPPAAAENIVQTYVSHLRRALEPGRPRQPGLIITRRPGYVLTVEADLVDLHRAEDLARQGRRALAEGRPGPASRALGEALSLWRGPPLAEFADEPWALGQLVRIDELRLTTAEEAAEARLALGRPGEVIAELQEAVAASPLRERLTGLLMLALYRCGRQADALAAYRQLRLRLGEELGIEPSAEIARLEEAMVLQKPELEWRPRGRHREAARPPDKPFVGREAELSTIVSALDGAERGRGQVALVNGEPGIGKTRLVEEVAFIASSRGHLVAWGRCYEGDGSPPYWVWAYALRELLEEAPTASYAAELQVLLPDVELDLVTDNPESARFRLFDGLARFLVGIARHQPLVVVLDDLQWADPGSLLCLEHLASEAGRAPIAIFGTYRDTEVTPPLSATVARIARERGGQVLHLDGLGEEAVRSYLEERLGSSSSSAAARLADRTSGNPFFMEQLVAGGDDSASVDPASWAPSVPTTLRDVIVERCRRLPRGAEALATAAVVGTEFDLAVVTRVLPDEGDLLDHMDAATRAGILAEVGGHPGRYRFAHDLVREALLSTWSELRVTRLHRRIGEALEAVPLSDRRSRTSELAHHFRLAARDGSEIDKAIGYCLAAARSATETLAYEDALAHSQAAVELADTIMDPGSRLRCEARLALGEARWRGGDVGQARATFLAAAEIARAAGDTRLLAQAALGFGGGFVRDWHATRGVFGDQVVVLLEEAITGLADTEPRLRARLLGQLAEELYYELDEGRRARLSAEAVSLARSEDDAETLACCLASRCAAMWGPDGLDHRLADASELILLAERLASRELGLFARHYLFAAQLESGDTAAATATLDGFDVLADEVRLPLYRWEGRWFRALLALIGGRFEEAEQLAGEAVEIGTATGDPDALAVYGAQIAIVRLEQGRIAELYDSLVAFADEFVESPVWQAALCYVDAELGRVEDAERSFGRLAAGGFSGLPRNFGYLASLAMLATVCARLGDRARAAQLRQLLLPYVDRHILTADRHSWGSAALYVAMLEAALGHEDAAEVRFSQATEANERMGAWPWLAHTLHEHASAIANRDPARARLLAVRADQLANELGMKRLPLSERRDQGRL